MYLSHYKDIKDFLDEKYQKYNCPEYIDTDPIQIPHLFSKQENIEISAFLTATIAWGQRKTIINNSKHLINFMDNNPYDFIINAKNKDFKRFGNFKHRTFNGEDCIYFLFSLQNIYKKYGGLKKIFEDNVIKTNNVKNAIIFFRKIFFELPYPQRTQKHIADITKNSSAKRINMFLRWMVRKDDFGVDFGIWNKIPSSLLFIPLDVHCGRIARKLNLLSRKQNDWKAVEELTDVLKQLDIKDPVKYDFALFGLGVFENF
ncbi:MAG: TIGR02757 family protein [Bacteroidales bacterium]|nr:TIGR02757 family protein [Bacteroidales bacterium]